MTERNEIRTDKGSALIAVLILLLVATVAGAGWIAATHNGIHISQLFRSKSTLEELAQSGFEMAKADLFARAAPVLPDFNTPPDWRVPAEGPAFYPIHNPEYVGLVRSTIGESSLPRIQFTRDSLKLSVWYYPSSENKPLIADPTDPENNSMDSPRFYRIVSTAENPQSGSKYTYEAEISLQRIGFAELDYALFNPQPLPHADPNKLFPLRTATYDGHVHFGPIQPYFLDTPLFGVSKHIFKGPVTFELNVPDGSLPFDYDPATYVDFQYGWKGNFHVSNYISRDLLDKLAVEPTRLEFNLDPSSAPTGEVCLEFTADGYVKRYDCNSSAADFYYDPLPASVSPAPDGLPPRDRYGSTPIATYPITPNMVIYGNNVEIGVRGIVNGRVTVACDADSSHDPIQRTGNLPNPSPGNCKIEGDIDYAHQGKNSGDSFGMVALRNIDVPHYVSVFRHWDSPTDTPSSNQVYFDGKSNFSVPNTEVDRDAEDNEYRENDVPYAHNIPGILDLSGAFIALGDDKTQHGLPTGILYVENINDYDLSDDGIVVPDVTGALWAHSPVNTSNPGHIPYYYNVDGQGKPVSAKARPLYCRAHDADTTWWGSSCDFSNSLVDVARAGQAKIWLYGSLGTKGFSQLNAYTHPDNDRTQGGFNRIVFRHDPALSISPPPLFPQTNQTKLNLVWQKQYSGSAITVVTLP